MKHIQWFPGHMAKAMRMIEENIPLVDGIIYVLDARAPFATLNTNFERLLKHQKVLYILNKSDLAIDTDKTIAAFKNNDKTAIGINSLDNKSGKIIYDAVTALLQDRIDQFKQKGISGAVRVMVIGIPNTGKSTVINAVAGRRSAAVGDKAGVTRGKQWIRLKNIELMDTPGSMPPSFADQETARELAYLGCMNDDILDFVELAYEFIKKVPFAHLKARYNIVENTPENILEQICAHRGCMLRKGEYDLERGARILIDDFRKGRLGKMSF